MIIQVGHARASEYESELYEPFRRAPFFQNHTWIFPHDVSRRIDSRETLKTVDLFIAEVSTPATGLGIEIGIASAYGKDILCIYKNGSKISSSLRKVTEYFIEYDSSEDMMEKVGAFLKNK